MDLEGPGVIISYGSQMSVNTGGYNMSTSWEDTTLPETNIAPENGWLEYYFPFGMVYFQGLC